MNTSSDKPQGDSLKRTPASEQAEQNIRETSSVCKQSAKSGLPLFMRVPRNPHEDAGAAHSCDTRKNEPKSSSFGGYGSPDTITAASAPMPHMAPEPSGTGHGAPRTALDHPDKEDTSPNKGETAFEEPLSQEPDSRRAISVDPEGTAVFEPEPAQDSPSPHTPGGASGLGEAVAAAKSSGPEASSVQAPEAQAWDYQKRDPHSTVDDDVPLSMEKREDVTVKKGWGLGKANKPEKKGGRTSSKPSVTKPKPTYEPFTRSHPVLSVEQTMPPSIGSRLYKILALSPVIFLSLMLVLQTIFTLDARELWFSDEIRHADAFKNLLEHGKWLILEMNGQPYPDKPPLYFWFLRGLYELLRTDGPMLYFTAAAISGLFYLWASLGLGRNVARVDGATNLAAGILLLSTAYVMGTLHYARMDLLFSALILGSHIVLYRTYVSPKFSPVGMAAAFALAGLACLVKGPLGLAFPLCSLLLFALWRGTADQLRCVVISVLAVFFGLLPGLFGLELAQLFKLNPDVVVNPISQVQTLSLQWSLPFLALPLVIGLLLIKFAPKLRICVALSLVLMFAAFALNGGTPYFHWPLLYVLPVCALALFAVWQISPQRFFRLDFFIGLAVGVLIPGLWLAAIYWQTGNFDFILNSLLKEQVLERALDTFHHKESWYYYFVRFPLMLLPWFLLVFFLPWRKLLSKKTGEDLSLSRKPEKEGLAYLWCMVISALILLSALSGKILIYLLPVLPALAVLGARAALALKGSRALLFRYSLTGLLFLAGVLTILLALMLFGVLPMPDINGLPQWRMESHGGFYVVGGLMLAVAAFLGFGLGSSRPEGVLLVMAIASTALSYPLAGLVAPSFDDVLSPRDQSLVMRAYIDQGYAPASYKVYGGTYSFYTDHVINELKKQEEILPLAERGKLILGMRASIFDDWQDRPACLKEVHRQWIETREYVLLACPPLEGLEPARDPYSPAPEFMRELLKLVGIEIAPREKKVPVIKAQPPAAVEDPGQPVDDGQVNEEAPAGASEQDSDSGPEDSPVQPAPDEATSIPDIPAEDKSRDSTAPLEPSAPDHPRLPSPADPAPESQEGNGGAREDGSTATPAGNENALPGDPEGTNTAPSEAQPSQPGEAVPIDQPAPPIETEPNPDESAPEGNPLPEHTPEEETTAGTALP